MSRADKPTRQRLVLRFAAASLAAFLVIGTVLAMVIVRRVRVAAEDNAEFHARYAVDAVLAPEFRGGKLIKKPLEGLQLARIDNFVRERLLTDGRTVRVKIWTPGGLILYSDERALIGRTFTDELHEFAEVMEGHVETEISNLESAENVEERQVADKLFQTYVPLTSRRSDEPIAIAEIYQDYSTIQTQIDGVVRTLAVALTIGLGLLYGLLLPIARGASKRLRRQNEQLRVQAESLEELLSREQETVAELRRLNQMQSDFVAAASHELRTPLTSVIGYLRTLRRPEMREDPQATEEFLAAGERAATRLSHLVQNLLSAAHLEEGARSIELSMVGIEDLVATVLDDLASGAERVRVHAGNLPPVRTDRQRLREVLRNLVENALKYSEDHEPVDIDAELSGDELVIHVRDRGVGIDPGDQPAIFERFHQLDQSATREFGGLGLGLHLSKQFMDEIGGSIAVRSDVGHGSTFTVRVPLTVRVDRAEPDPESESLTAGSNAPAAQ
jgi:signal transduction histidine kinase